MKKIFATILFLILSACSVLFAACSGADPTKVEPRWEMDGEEWSFTISKRDDVDTFQIHNNETYLYAPVVSNYEADPANLDQMVPLNVGGTYTMKIQPTVDDKQCTYSTHQVLYAMYNTADLQKTSVWEQLQSYIANDDPANPLEVGNNCTVLKSVTDTEVTFVNESSQRPLNSKNSAHGFYLGKIQQNISDYEMTTVYNWEEETATVTINGEQKVNELSGDVIDANQMLLYVRSLEKTSNMLQDGHTVQVYQPYYNTTSSASFVFTYTCNAIIVNGNSEAYVKVNAVAVILDGSALLVQLNVPDSANKTTAVDGISNGGPIINKYTTLHFRSSYICYTLDPCQQLDAFIAALQSDAEA